MKRITIRELNELSIGKMALDSTSLDLSTIEGVAGALRRGAGFLCPCTNSELADYVVESIEDVVEKPAELREVVDDTLEALISYGDLVECRMTGDGRSNGTDLLYLTPPSFVSRQNGNAFL